MKRWLSRIGVGGALALIGLGAVGASALSLAFKSDGPASTSDAAQAAQDSNSGDKNDKNDKDDWGGPPIGFGGPGGPGFGHGPGFGGRGHFGGGPPSASDIKKMRAEMKKRGHNEF